MKQPSSGVSDWILDIDEKMGIVPYDCGQNLMVKNILENKSTHLSDPGPTMVKPPKIEDGWGRILRPPIILRPPRLRSPLFSLSSSRLSVFLFSFSTSSRRHSRSLSLSLSFSSFSSLSLSFIHSLPFNPPCQSLSVTVSVSHIIQNLQKKHVLVKPPPNPSVKPGPSLSFFFLPAPIDSWKIFIPVHSFLPVFPSLFLLVSLAVPIDDPQQPCC